MMLKLLFLAFALTVSCLVVASLPSGQDWTSFARCLPMDYTETSSDDILQFIRRHSYLIVPPSNPPSQFHGTRTESKRSIYTGRCPFKFQVKDFVDTIPRFLSNATCRGCDDRCKPVTYTQQMLRRKCGNYWLWEEQEVRVAYVLEQ